jgi:hypothetical protein
MSGTNEEEATTHKHEKEKNLCTYNNPSACGNGVQKALQKGDTSEAWCGVWTDTLFYSFLGGAFYRGDF